MTAQFGFSCQQCGLKEICLPNNLSEEEMEVLDSKVKRSKPLHRGVYLFESGDSFKSIYAVRSGAIKLFSINDEGDEQVIGFFLPGELLGLDAIDSQVHTSSAKALETSSVCEIPYTSVEQLSEHIHNLRTHMYRLLSREIRCDQEFQMLLAKNTAEGKIAAFLMNLSLRYKQRHLSSKQFRLPMARTEIGNYLGLAVETVSRVFTRLQKKDIIRADGKEIEILDPKVLCNIAHHADEI